MRGQMSGTRVVVTGGKVFWLSLGPSSPIWGN